MFTNNLIAGASGQSTGFYPYAIDQSLRFNDDDSAYLSRTPASVGTDRTVWTFSVWVKRGNITGTVQTLFSAGGTVNDYSWIRIDSDETLNILNNTAGVNRCNLTTSAVFRDTSAWYHLVFNRNGSSGAKIYVNGVEQSATGTNYSGTTIDFFADTIAGSIGRLQRTGALYFDGYMAEAHFIDGQALDPTDFGEFKSGVWVAKSYAGSYGTNGFYLNFSDSANIGDDLSGNANDWTANNLVATDVVLDSPTQNWATLNPLKRDGTTLSEGNLKAVVGTSGGRNTTSTFAVSSGKWYAESVCTANTINSQGFGVTNVNRPNSTLPYTYGDGVIYYASTGQKYIDGTNTAYGATYTTGDIIGLALDLDNDEITFYKNGVSQGTITTKVFDGSYEIVLPNFTGSYTVTYVANFGQDSSFAGNETAQGNTDDNGNGDFYYSPPSGFLCLSSVSLPDPAIDPAQDESPADYFNTVLYTGNGSTQSITGVGFQPDWVWIKERNSTSDHMSFDAVRGATKRIRPNTTNAEDTVANSLTSFDADGFSLGSDASVNESPSFTYASWNWLAGNGTSSNSDGTISSTISVNQKAGFSIVSYTGNGSAGATVGHGLNSKPDFVIFKNRDTAATDWIIYHSALTVSQYMAFDTSAVRTISNLWDGMTSTVLEVDNYSGYNNSGDDIIAYCFAEVEGYSKFGSFVGNGSNDGPMIFTGHSPAFLMVKRTDSSGDWYMFDKERATYNAVTTRLWANLSSAELSSSVVPFDFLSNGFKARNSDASFNASGGTYIYMAFAENPFKYANAR